MKFKSYEVIKESGIRFYFRTNDDEEIRLFTVNYGNKWYVEKSHLPNAESQPSLYNCDNVYGDTPENALNELFSAWEAQFPSISEDEISWEINPNYRYR